MINGLRVPYKAPVVQGFRLTCTHQNISSHCMLLFIGSDLATSHLLLCQQLIIEAKMTGLLLRVGR